MQRLGEVSDINYRHGRDPVLPMYLQRPCYGRPGADKQGEDDPSYGRRQETTGRVNGKNDPQPSSTSSGQNPPRGRLSAAR